jgi:hypothetical protein
VHDPLVLLWTIKRPPLTPEEWRKKRWPPLLDIWHREPDGRDSGTVCPYRIHWRHPHHWHLRFWPVFNFRSRFKRCGGCGRRMNTAARFGYMGTGKVWHDECQALGHLRQDMTIMTETLDRLVTTMGITTRDELRAVVARPEERRDQFLLYYRPWERLDSYRAKPPGERWRAPNEHLPEARPG